MAVDDGVARSRCCRRILRKKGDVWPLVFAGLIGGPLGVIALTPLRNALSLAAADQESSTWQIYKSTFPDGLSSGWTGGMPSGIAACPQFVMVGPVFHLAKNMLGSSILAVCVSAACESAVTYGALSKNAQMARNQELEHSGSSEKIPLADPFMPWGPGIGFLWLGNAAAISGIRVLSQAVEPSLSRLSLRPAAKNLLSDGLAMLGGACMSAPLIQLFNFAVTSPAYREASGLTGKFREGIAFLDSFYLLRNDGGTVYGLTPTLGRDSFLRCMYVGNLLIFFSLIERIFVAVGKSICPKTKP